jgi:hypothetical protein
MGTVDSMNDRDQPTSLSFILPLKCHESIWALNVFFGTSFLEPFEEPALDL